MKNDYVVKKVYQSFVLVSILTALTVTFGMLIDNIIIGRFFGTTAIGAVGIAVPIGLIFSMIGNISSSGGTARAAHALGQGDTEHLNRLFSVSILYTVVAGGILTVFGIIFTPQIAVFLGARDELIVPATEYIRGYFLGAVPIIMLPTLTGFVKVDGSVHMPLISMIVMSVSNIVLDLLMVTVFRQGMFGMALATTISYCLAVAVDLTHFMKKKCLLRFILPKKIITELKSIAVSGSPTAVSRICTTFEIAIFNNLLVTAAGVGAVAAMNVRTQAYNIIGAVTMGVGQALIPVAGMFFGEEDRSALRGTMRATLKLGMTLSVTAGALLFFMAPVFAKLLGVSDPEVLSMANTAMRTFAVSMPVQLFNLVWMNFYQSTKKSGQAIMVCILHTFAYAVLAAFALIRLWGSNGVWFAFVIGEILAAITLYVYVACKNKKLLPGISDYMLLDKDFGSEYEKRWELSIGNSMEQVMTLSNQITELGKTADMDRHTLNTLALCIEEMAGNVVRHAFSPGEKKWFDVMILNKDDSMIVRMRDNGKEFDPVRYLHENKDTENGRFGIRLISALSDQFKYRRTIGLNNLIIVVNKKSNYKGE